MNSFWNHIKKISRKIKESSVPDLVITNEDGSQSPVSSDLGKAETLNSFFARQTHLPNCPSTFPTLPALSQMSPVSFYTTPAEVFDTLCHLKPGKAPGPDGIPPRLLQLCTSGISVSLATLFNRSFSEGSIPTAWKEALVVPVYEGGDKSSLSNYRPIALLSHVSKTMEKIILSVSGLSSIRCYLRSSPASANMTAPTFNSFVLSRCGLIPWTHLTWWRLSSLTLKRHSIASAFPASS